MSIPFSFQHQHRAVFSVISDLPIIDQWVQHQLSQKPASWLYFQFRQRSIQQYLGKSIQKHVILDAREGIDLDEFSAFIGSICGGFLLLLLLPLKLENRSFALDQTLILEVDQPPTHYCLNRLITQLKKHFPYQLVEAEAALNSVNQAIQDLLNRLDQTETSRSTSTTISPHPGTPISSTPISSTPISSTPISSTPISSTPISSTPISSTPISSTPISSTPISSTPISSTPNIPIISLAGQYKQSQHLWDALAHFHIENELQLLASLSANPEQYQLVLKLLLAFLSDKKAYLPLLAQRGTGKSAGLGLAIGILLARGQQTLYLSASLFDQVQEVIRFCKIMLAHLSLAIEEGEEGHHRFIVINLPSKNSQLYFIYPHFIDTIKPVKLIIDECASLAVNVLHQALSNANQIVLSTTIHGYEGNARGFALRLLPQLQSKSKALTILTLTHPIRWAKGDPLEQFAYDVLLIDQSLDRYFETQSKIAVNHHLLRYECLDRQRLAQDEALLKACFGILLKAHYQTTPNDLWRMLDAPNLSIHAAMEGDILVGALLFTLEGLLTEKQAEALFFDQSRPRGQLLPTNLSVHLQLPELAHCKLYRLMRLAILPEKQNQGIGRFLLEKMDEYALQHQIDFIGASFSVSAPLVYFWKQNGYIPVRLSLRANRNSGDHSILMLRSCRLDLSLTYADQLYQPLDFLYQLRATEHSLPLALIKAYLSAIPYDRIDLISSIQPKEWHKLLSIAYVGRSYELALQPTYLLCLQYFLDQQSFLHLSYESLILHKILQGLSRQQIIQEQAIKAPTLIMKGISWAIRQLLTYYAPSEILAQSLCFPQSQEGIPNELKLI